MRPTTPRNTGLRCSRRKPLTSGTSDRQLISFHTWKKMYAVKKMLTLLGAREDQIESVSLGEEKPSCNEHTEACYAKNRRDDMLYSGEY